MGVIHRPPGSGLWLSDPFRQDSGMRMIRIVESYERGVYILNDSGNRDSRKVGNLRGLIRAAEAMAGTVPTTVLVVDQCAEVMKCLRYLPGRTVIEEDPRLIYDQPVF